MTTLASLRIILGLDSKDVRDGAGSAKRELQGVQAQAKATDASLRGIGKGIVAGFGIGAGLSAFSLAKRTVGEFTDAIGDAVRASIEEEAGIKRLGQSLVANIPGWEGNTDAIERRIKKGEELAFSDGDLRDSLGSLVAATHDVEQAFAIQEVAMDLARFKGISLGEATNALIKVEGGQFRALKGLGIVLEEGATQVEALAAVQRVAAGQAEAYGKTTAGALEKMDVAIENLQENIGTRLAPAVAKGAGAITDFLHTLDLAPAVFQALGLEVQFLAKVLDHPLDSEAIKKDFADLEHAAFNLVISYNDTYTASRNGEDGVQKFGKAAVVAADDAKTATTATDLLAAALNALPTTVDINVVTTFTSAQSGVGAGSTPTGVEETGNITQPLIDLANDRAADRQRKADEARRKAEEARRKAEAAAEKAEREHADAIRDKLAAAYDVLADRAHDAFSKIHDDNLKLIDDSRDRANAELSAQQDSIRGAVSAERDRIEAIRNHRQELELRSAVNAATDPADKARAQQALNDFLDDQRLAFLGNQADIKIAALDSEKRKNDEIAAAAKAREDKRYADQVAAFDADLKLLKTHLDKAEGHWGTYFADIVKLAKQYGVTDLVGISPTATKPTAATTPTSNGRVAATGAAGATGFTGKDFAAMSQIEPAEVVIHNHFYVDGDPVYDSMKRTEARRNMVYSPARPSTGSRR